MFLPLISIYVVCYGDEKKIRINGTHNSDKRRLTYAFYIPSLSVFRDVTLIFESKVVFERNRELSSDSIRVRSAGESPRYGKDGAAGPLRLHRRITRLYERCREHRESSARMRRGRRRGQACEKVGQTRNVDLYVAADVRVVRTTTRLYTTWARRAPSSRCDVTYRRNGINRLTFRNERILQYIISYLILLDTVDS